MIIRAASVYYPNFVTEIKDNCTNQECFKGISGTVWGILADNLNFTYTISKEYGWGSLENGTWSGMIGNLFLYLIIYDLECNLILPYSHTAYIIQHKLYLFQAN